MTRRWKSWEHVYEEQQKASKNQTRDLPSNDGSPVSESSYGFSEKSRARRHSGDEAGDLNQLGAVLVLFDALGLPEPVTEYQFHPTRKWRFDYAWPAQKIALEVEGGVWICGRHNRASGYVRDIRKYNAAKVAGWTVLQCLPEWLSVDNVDAQLVEHLERLFKTREAA